MFPGNPKILVVDDEPLAGKRLKALCERLVEEAQITIASGGKAALNQMTDHEFDVVLLDVDMPDISGLDVASQCQNLEEIPEVIFTTAHSKYAVDAFRLEATDYLLKPVKQKLLKEALERAAGRIARRSGGQPSTEDQRVWVKDQKGAIQLRVVDVERVEADRDYMKLLVAGRHYLVHGSMRALEETFPKDLFVRVHRSAMVRKDLIEQIRREGRRHFLVLADGTELTVGPSYLDRVSESLLPHLGGVGGSEAVIE